MGPGGETHDQQPRPGVAESGNGFAPVFPVAEFPFFLPRDAPAVSAQARTALARDDGAVNGD